MFQKTFSDGIKSKDLRNVYLSKMKKIKCWWFQIFKFVEGKNGILIQKDKKMMRIERELNKIQKEIKNKDEIQQSV